jgi:hypothetical protein
MQTAICSLKKPLAVRVCVWCTDTCMCLVRPRESCPASSCRWWEGTFSFGSRQMHRFTTTYLCVSHIARHPHSLSLPPSLVTMLTNARAHVCRQNDVCMGGDTLCDHHSYILLCRSGRGRTNSQWRNPCCRRRAGTALVISAYLLTDCQIYLC